MTIAPGESSKERRFTDTLKVRMAPDLLERLRRCAHEDGLTVPELTRRLVTEHVGDRHAEVGSLTRRLREVAKGEI
jgi:hypothetical protein